MIQLKEFPEDTTIDEINKFLSKSIGAIILQYKPFLIQHVVPDIVNPVLMELVGIPRLFRFTNRDDEETIRCGHILFLRDYIIFNDDCGDAWRMTYTYHLYEPGKKRKLALANVRFIGFTHNTHYGILTNQDDLERFRSILAKECGIVSTSPQHTYNDRTNVVEKVGIAQALALREIAYQTQALAIATAGGSYSATVALEEFYEPKKKQERLAKQRKEDYERLHGINDDSPALRTQLNGLKAAGAKKITMNSDDKSIIIEI